MVSTRICVYCMYSTCDVDLFGQSDVALSHSRKHHCVVNQPADVVVHHNLPQVLIIQDVGEDEWT